MVKFVFLHLINGSISLLAAISASLAQPWGPQEIQGKAAPNIQLGINSGISTRLGWVELGANAE